MRGKCLFILFFIFNTHLYSQEFVKLFEYVDNNQLDFFSENIYQFSKKTERQHFLDETKEGMNILHYSALSNKLDFLREILELFSKDIDFFKQLLLSPVIKAEPAQESPGLVNTVTGFFGGVFSGVKQLFTTPLVEKKDYWNGYNIFHIIARDQYYDIFNLIINYINENIILSQSEKLNFLKELFKGQVYQSSVDRGLDFFKILDKYKKSDFFKVIKGLEKFFNQFDEHFFNKNKYNFMFFVMSQEGDDLANKDSFKNIVYTIDNFDPTKPSFYNESLAIFVSGNLFADFLNNDIKNETFIKDRYYIFNKDKGDFYILIPQKKEKTSEEIWEHLKRFNLRKDLNLVSDYKTIKDIPFNNDNFKEKDLENLFLKQSDLRNLSKHLEYKNMLFFTGHGDYKDFVADWKIDSFLNLLKFFSLPAFNTFLLNIQSCFIGGLNSVIISDFIKKHFSFFDKRYPIFFIGAGDFSIYNLGSKREGFAKNVHLNGYSYRVFFEDIIRSFETNKIKSKKLLLNSLIKKLKIKETEYEMLLNNNLIDEKGLKDFQKDLIKKYSIKELLKNIKLQEFTDALNKPEQLENLKNKVNNVIVNLNKILEKLPAQTKLKEQITKILKIKIEIIIKTLIYIFDLLEDQREFLTKENLLNLSEIFHKDYKFYLGINKIISNEFDFDYNLIKFCLDLCPYQSTVNNIAKILMPKEDVISSSNKLNKENDIYNITKFRQISDKLEQYKKGTNLSNNELTYKIEKEFNLIEPSDFDLILKIDPIKSKSILFTSKDYNRIKRIDIQGENRIFKKNHILDYIKTLFHENFEIERIIHIGEVNLNGQTILKDVFLTNYLDFSLDLNNDNKALLIQLILLVDSNLPHKEKDAYFNSLENLFEKISKNPETLKTLLIEPIQLYGFKGCSILHFILYKENQKILDLLFDSIYKALIKSDDLNDDYIINYLKNLLDNRVSIGNEFNGFNILHLAYINKKDNIISKILNFIDKFWTKSGIDKAKEIGFIKELLLSRIDKENEEFADLTLIDLVLYKNKGETLSIILNFIYDSFIDKELLKGDKLSAYLYDLFLSDSFTGINGFHIIASNKDNSAVTLILEFLNKICVNKNVSRKVILEFIKDLLILRVNLPGHDLDGLNMLHILVGAKNINLQNLIFSFINDLIIKSIDLDEDYIVNYLMNLLDSRILLEDNSTADESEGFNFLHLATVTKNFSAIFQILDFIKGLYKQGKITEEKGKELIKELLLSEVDRGNEFYAGLNLFQIIEKERIEDIPDRITNLINEYQLEIDTKKDLKQRTLEAK